MVKEIREELKKVLRSKSAMIPNILMILNGFFMVFYSKNMNHVPRIESIYQYPFCAVMLLVAAHCSLCFLVLCCLRGNAIWANVINIGVTFFLPVWAIEKVEFTRKTMEGKLFWYYGDYVVQDALLSKGFLTEILYSIAVFAAASLIGLFVLFIQKKNGRRGKEK